MKLRLDLHIHSQYSHDGRMTIEEIVMYARNAGLNGVAICDHDCVLTEWSFFHNFLLIPGVEISTEYGHLLGWFLSKPIKTKNFFEAVSAIHAQGGLAVLAHPFEHSKNAERLAPIVPFLDGAEVWNSRAERKNRHANNMAEHFAQIHHLRRFAGSDAHLPQEIGNGVTSVEADSLTLDAIKKALLTGNTQISGRRSLAIYTAASQFTHHLKTNADLASYGKWALFAAKCWLEDKIGRNN